MMLVLSSKDVGGLSLNSLHLVEDRARTTAGNGNVNIKWLAGHLKQQYRDVPAGICCTLCYVCIKTQADKHCN